MFVKKAKIEQFGTDLKITIPSEKNLRFPLFAVLWFVVWYFAFNFALKEEGIFIKIWLICWSFAGLFMLLLLLWFLFGYEQLNITKSKIKVSASVFGLGINKTIARHQFRACISNEEDINERNKNKGTIYLNSLGKIKIIHQFSSFSFGAALGDEETKYLVDYINRKINQ